MKNEHSRSNTVPKKVEGSHVLENLKLFFTVDNVLKIYSA